MRVFEFTFVLPGRVCIAATEESLAPIPRKDAPPDELPPVFVLLAELLVVEELLLVEFDELDDEELLRPSSSSYWTVLSFNSFW